MAALTIEQIHRLAPNAKPNYIASLIEAGVMASFDISTPLRIQHFVAQVLHESGALTILVESLRYTHAQRICDVWPTRFPTIESAQPFVSNPEALANKVYGGRMGNVNPGDGWKYIGRGLLQTTGHDAYVKLGLLLGIPLAENPDLAFSAKYALRIAAAEWRANNCNAAADADDIKLVTKRVNGGQVGIDERKARLAEVRKVLR